MTGGKATIGDLAVLGGRPAFSESLVVNRPTIGDRDAFLTRVEEMLDRRWLTNDGPLVSELEERLARYLGVKNCVATCNGTQALGLASRALGLSGEVIVPSFTFVATAHAMLWNGIEPIFCDIDEATWNIDPAQCEALITERTTGIVGVHLWGRPCDTRSLETIARRHGLRLLFDAAHAFGCTHRGKRIGGFGDAEILSFHATKVFHTFEGGAVATDDDELASRIRRMRNFGFTDYDQVSELGTNAKMSEASAAMGLANLGSFAGHIQDNRRKYEAYAEGLDDAPGLQLLRYDGREKSNYHYVVLEVEEEQAGLSRDHVLRVLHAENVLARRYFYPGCHRSEPYRSHLPAADSMLPNTCRIADRVLVLPTGGALTSQQLGEVCQILHLAITDPGPVRSAIESDGTFSVGPHAAESASDETPRGPLIMSRATTPRLEIRVPISPNEANLRMLRYLLESLRTFGGPVGRAAHCVASVGADEPPRDLAREYGFDEHSVEFQWVDRQVFRERSYDATGFHRYCVDSDADVVALLDADLLIAGDFDRVVVEAHQRQRFLGCIAHVSPFDIPELRSIPSHRWWHWIFEEAGLPKPRLDWTHTGWGLMTNDVRHRRCPAYYNYGFLVAPRSAIELMAETYEEDLDAVERVVESWAKAQIANTLSRARLGISCGALPTKFNFPLHVEPEAFRALNQDPDETDSDEDVRAFHYLGTGEINRDHFATRETVDELLQRSDLSSAATVFREKLRVVDERIDAAATDAPRLDVPEFLHRNHPSVSAAGHEHTGQLLIDLATRRCGLKSLARADILDLGCGVRFAMTIINRGIAVKSYTGQEVDRPIVNFLNEKVASVDRRFEFAHWDVCHPIYNPDGVDLSTRSALPVAKTFDLIWAFSVFTHLPPSDTRALFRILRKHIRPEGRFFFSAFIDEDLIGFDDRAKDEPLLHAYYGSELMLSLLDEAGWRVDGLYGPDPDRAIMHSLLCSPRRPHVGPNPGDAPTSSPATEANLVA